MNTAEKHLTELNALLERFERESGDVVLGRMMPIFASLLVRLSRELDEQRKVVRLTWGLFWLTLLLAFIAVAQLAVSMPAGTMPTLTLPPWAFLVVAGIATAYQAYRGFTLQGLFGAAASTDAKSAPVRRAVLFQLADAWLTQFAAPQGSSPCGGRICSSRNSNPSLPFRRPSAASWRFS